MDRPFTYLIPEGCPAEVGKCAVVPFAHREELGYILSLTEGPELPPDLWPAGAVEDAFIQHKTIKGVLDTPPVFDRATASLFSWMTREYLCSLADTLRCVIPASRMASVRTLVKLKGHEDKKGEKRLSPTAARVLENLNAAGGEADLGHIQGTIRTPRLAEAIRQLARRGKIEVIRTTQQAKEERAVLGIQLVASPEEVELWLGAKKRGKRQAEILRHLLSLPSEPVAQMEVAGALGCGTGAFKPLVETGLVEAVMVPIRRNPWPDTAQIPLGLSLTPDQTDALQEIFEAIDRSSRSACDAGGTPGPDNPTTGDDLMAAPRPEVVLLRGVTGSGKTEVYLRAIEETRQKGRQSIALVPEISLTAQMIGIFHSRFDSRVAVLHSKLSDGERLDEWQRIRRGEVDVVIGARSGLFAPLPRLGLIVLDEEHESSYKQQGDPCYLARDTAIERARLVGACVILGSATPSLESARMASTGAARLALLPTRIDDRPLPPVSLVDQRRELKENPGHIFSRQLQGAIEARLQAGEQTILFLNRRGFATITLCRDCGYVARCKNCAVSLTFYVSSRLLRCHHCEYTIPAPDLCPGCSGSHIRQFGIGTEKVEAELAALFPDARTARMDTDSLSRKGSAQDLVDRFRAGRIDILVGTQMVAKGFDFPGVTLVGVISADTMLNLPDFRASERTFQILTQVSGRAGRGDTPGEVIVQTFNPEHYAIQAAARHDFDEFYRQELPMRREARYPPFVRLANLVVEGWTRAEARGRAEVVGAQLIEAIGSDPVELLGPAPAPLTRIKSRFRWHLLLKAEDGALIRNACRTMRSHLKPDELQHLTIDLDPMSLL